MFAFIQIIIATCPIVPLFYFATKVYGFCNVLNKRRCIRKKIYHLKELKIFFRKT